jgi:hypothetical protein
VWKSYASSTDNLIIPTVRMLIPTADRGMRDKPSETEIEVFSEYRVHNNVTLATFVIAAIYHTDFRIQYFRFDETH